MEFKASNDIKVSVTKNDMEVTFKVLSDSRDEVYQSLSKYDKDIKVEVKEFREKRSLDQNSYFWYLVNEIANKTQRKREDVYKDYIQDCGMMQIVPIKKEAVSDFMRMWSAKGLGWFCKDMGDAKWDGFARLAIYFGSSVYNTKEMERLIDAVIVDCEDLGIETKSKEEIMSYANDNDEVEQEDLETEELAGE